MAEQTGPVYYEIRIRGLLGKTLLGAFPGMCAQAHEKETVLSGPVADQAALHGVLAEIEALGLELLESGARALKPFLISHIGRKYAAIHESSRLDDRAALSTQGLAERAPLGSPAHGDCPSPYPRAHARLDGRGRPRCSHRGGQ